MIPMIIILSATIVAVGIDCESITAVTIGVLAFCCTLKPCASEPHFLDVEVLKDE